MYIESSGITHLKVRKKFGMYVPTVYYVKDTQGYI